MALKQLFKLQRSTLTRGVWGVQVEVVPLMFRQQHPFRVDGLTGPHLALNSHFLAPGPFPTTPW